MHSQLAIFGGAVWELLESCRGAPQGHALDLKTIKNLMLLNALSHGTIKKLNVFQTFNNETIKEFSN